MKLKTVYYKYMISINKDSANSLIFTLTERSELINPKYLFSFTNDSSGKQSLFNMADISSWPRRYSQMVLTEAEDAGCLFAFGAVGFELGVDTNGDFFFDVDAVETPGSISSGTLVSVEYSVTQYEGGVQTGLTNGILLAGDGITETIPAVAGSVTFVQQTTANYSDGLETILSLVTTTDQSVSPALGQIAIANGIDFPASYNCVDTDIEVLNPRVVGDGPAKSVTPAWYDSDGNFINSGDTFDGAFPYTNNSTDLLFTLGLDITQWPDLPQDGSVNARTIASLSVSADIIALDPTQGEVNLEFGWGEYEVYESAVATLDIAQTTGRILEKGKYFVKGFTEGFNNNTNSVYDNGSGTVNI